MKIHVAVDDGRIWTATFRLDELVLDQLITDLQIEKYKIKGKSTTEATQLVETHSKTNDLVDDVLGAINSDLDTYIKKLKNGDIPQEKLAEEYVKRFGGL